MSCERYESLLFKATKLVLTVLADVDRFKICIQDCVLPDFRPLLKDCRKIAKADRNIMYIPIAYPNLTWWV